MKCTISFYRTVLLPRSQQHPSSLLQFGTLQQVELYAASHRDLKAELDRLQAQGARIAGWQIDDEQTPERNSY